VISVAEASERILARIGALSGEAVATGNAGGLVLAEAVTAPLTSPPWNNSSMDGYAVRSTDLADGITLPVVESVAAGSLPSRAIAPGEAMRVMTGAPVPAGADTVIRHEDTDNGRDAVRILNLRDKNRNVRKAGEDFAKGDTLFERGQLLGIAHLGVLASAGIKQVQVHRRPRVATITSGDELVELDDFDPGMTGSRIVSSNSVTLTAAIRDAGGEAIDLGIALDDPGSLREKFAAALDTDLIVTSAGLSVGDHDHVRDVFAELGGRLDFWKVRMRPGAPLAFGTLGGKPWIGLSGNPVSAIVTFELFVRPVIRRMLGMKDIYRATVPVRISEPITIAASLMHFLRIVMTRSDGGDYFGQLAGSQSSAVLTALARANALLILPGDRLEYAAGEIHPALPLGGGFDSTDSLRLT
jgi:molybdopterin molybdotransferase